MEIGTPAPLLPGMNTGASSPHERQRHAGVTEVPDVALLIRATLRPGRLSGRNGRRRFRVDGGAIELGAALVPHADPASALAQLGSGRQEIARQLVRGFRRT